MHISPIYRLAAFALLATACATTTSDAPDGGASGFASIEALGQATLAAVKSGNLEALEPLYVTAEMVAAACSQATVDKFNEARPKFRTKAATGLKPCASVAWDKAKVVGTQGGEASPDSGTKCDAKLQRFKHFVYKFDVDGLSVDLALKMPLRAGGTSFVLGAAPRCRVKADGAFVKIAEDMADAVCKCADAKCAAAAMDSIAERAAQLMRQGHKPGEDIGPSLRPAGLRMKACMVKLGMGAE